MLKTVKGKELIQWNKKDPIKVWKELLHHHKGNDASMDAVMKLLQHLFQLNAYKFNNWLRFLAEYDTIIKYYNKTNTAAMSDKMKQQFLRLGAVQDKELYQCYISFLAAKRTMTMGALSTTPPTYSEFYSILRQYAELLDSTKRQTQNCTKKNNRRTNLVGSGFGK